MWNFLRLFRFLENTKFNCLQSWNHSVWYASCAKFEAMVSFIILYIVFQKNNNNNNNKLFNILNERRLYLHLHFTLYLNAILLIRILNSWVWIRDLVILGTDSFRIFIFLSRVRILFRHFDEPGIWQFVLQCAGSGSSWPQTMVYGLTFLRRDGEQIMLLSMLLLVQNHGKMYMRCKTVVIELECKWFSLFYYEWEHAHAHSHRNHWYATWSGMSW